MKTLFASLLMFCAYAEAYSANIVKVTAQAMDGFGGDTGAILSRCLVKPGMVYDFATVSSDVNALKESGEFQDIKAEAIRVTNGVELVYKVYRKLRFQAPLVVSGNEAYGVSKILSESGLKDGQFYGEGDFAEAAEKVRLFYIKKHYPQARVTPIVKATGTGNSCTVEFLVEEGPKVKIKNYAFSSVANADEDELRKAIGVLPFWDPRSWFADKPVTSEQLAASVDQIVQYYANLGYLNAKVSFPEYVAGESGEVDTLLYKVEEGPHYKIGTSKITGLKSYSPEDVASKSNLPSEGASAGAKVLADAAERVATAVNSGDLGLADSRVSVRRIPRENDPCTLDIVYEVTEGVPVVIDNVVVTGNDYTKSNVIRREIELEPGDKMLADRAERSKKRLESLYYFSRVRYYLRDSGRAKNLGAEYRDLVYEVEEQNTGRFNFGVGASSVDSIYVSGEVSQSNFDLFAPDKLFRGAGQKGRLYAQVGPRIQTYEAEVTEPWFMARELELRVQAYRRQRWYDEYDVIRTGAAVSIDYPVLVWMPWKGLTHSESFGRFGIGLSGEFIELDEMTSGHWLFNNKEVSLSEKGGEDDRYGDAFEAVARIYWSRTQLDDFRMPKSGTRSRVFLDLASGDNEYWRLGLSHRNYFNVWERYNHVLMLALRAETIDAFSDEVPIYNRMFLGGPKSIRGIEYRYVSPLAKRKDSNQYTPWGGQTLLCVNAEYTIPVVKFLRLAFFSDAGSVGVDEFDFDVGDNFAWTAGIGFRIDIPSFPIRIDFAAPIEKPDHAEEEVFSFTIGYDF